jgi:hypothetical protein
MHVINCKCSQEFVCKVACWRNVKSSLYAHIMVGYNFIIKYNDSVSRQWKEEQRAFVSMYTAVPKCAHNSLFVQLFQIEINCRL